MEEQAAGKSRRERRKESRLAKNASKHQSWLNHQKSRAAIKGGSNDSELKTKSELDQSVSPNTHEKQVVKLESFSGKHEAAKEYNVPEEIRGSVPKKMSKDAQRSLRKKRAKMSVMDFSVEDNKDIELERKLSKKLKVKEGKLSGMDDGLNVLLEGMSSFADLMGEGEDSDTDEFPVKRLKKKSSSSKKHKLSKGKIEEQVLDGASGPLETYNQDVASEVPDSVPSRKNHKKRKSPDQQLEDDAEHDAGDMSKPPESCGTEVTSQVAPAEVLVKKAKEKYIAPHLRARAGNEPEEHTQIRRRVRGLLNRLSESNVESITGELSLIFQSVARSVASRITIEEILASCSSGPRGNEQYAAVFAAFVAGMACLVGIDFSAKFMASFAKCFEDEYHKEDNLSLRNLTLLLSYLCIFGVCSSDLIYDFLIMLSKRLAEMDVSIILAVLQCCGMKIRADDPTSMKNFILSVQNTSNKLKPSSGDDHEKKYSKRMEFMLETICDIKNNKSRAKEDPAHHTRIKKWLQKIRAVDIMIRGLKWSKLLDPDKKGQWWLSGDVASAADNVEEVADRIDKDVLETQRMLELAAAQKMNTDARRAIFCIIMSGEDYLDAFEKLLRLELPGKQDRDIMRVLVECCLQEKVFNKYYTVLAVKLCEYDKNHKFTLQFCLWDHFKRLETMPLLRSMHLSKFVAEMVASFTLSLAALKTVDLSDITLLTPKRIMHFRILFEAIFGKQSEEQFDEIKKQYSSLQKTLSNYKREENGNVEEGGDVVEDDQSLNVNTGKQTIEQQRNILRMLEKSLANEMDLEKKFSDSKQTEEKLRRRIVSLEQEIILMEEEATEVWEKWFEADNAYEILMGISKELLGKLQISQFNLNGLRQREFDLRAKLGSSTEQLKETDKVSSLEKQLKETECQLLNVKASADNYQEQYNFLSSEIRDMKNLVSQLKENVSTAESRANNAEAHCKSLTETNEELKKELTLLKDGGGTPEIVESLEKQMRESDLQLQHAVASAEASQEKQKMLYSTIDDMNHVMEDLKSNFSKAESRADSAEEKCIILSESNADLNEEINFLRSRLECLEESLHQVEESKMATAKDIGKRTKVFKNLVTQLALERERLNKQLSSLASQNKILVVKLKQTYKDPSQEVGVTLTTDQEVDWTWKNLSANDNEVKVADSVPDVETVRRIDAGALNFKHLFISVFVLLLSAVAYLYFKDMGFDASL